MTYFATSPSPIFVINTDTDSYRADHPEDKLGSPFFEHWLPNGYAYMTPYEKYDRGYAEKLAELEPGMTLFAYESKVGIVAMGTVKARVDPKEYSGGTALHPNPKQRVRRIEVAWDTSISCSLKRISAEYGKTVRGGPIPLWRVRDKDLLELLHRLKENSINRNTEKEEDTALVAVLNNPRLTEKDRQSITLARIGQGIFRSNVLAIEPKCRVTGIADPAYLRASHIKPWRKCENIEHLDGNNGLMLAPHVDHLFDNGMISFRENGTMLVSKLLDREVLRLWSIPEILNVGAFSVKQATYLAYHRAHIFKIDFADKS